MANKRERDDTEEDFQRNKSHSTVKTRPQKRRKQDGAATGTVYTVAQILDFTDGISNIKDWTSNELDQKHVQLIYWFDVEGLSRAECAKRYPNKDGKPCSNTNIFRTYIRYAPRFYAEKGLAFVPLGQRVIGRAKARTSVAPAPQRQGSIGSHQTVSKHSGVPYNVSRLDIELTKLFNGLPETAEPAADLQPPQQEPNRDQHIEATALQSDNHQVNPVSSTEETINFRCKAGDIGYECSGAIEMRQASAVEYCKVIREALQDNPDIRTIQYGHEFSADTVSRFVACCSPTLQSSLPGHVTTSFGTFKQEWTMPELEDLYVFAVSVGALEVCDMVIDFWHKEMQRSEQRVVRDEFGDAYSFSILDFGPEFLNFLHGNDMKGFNFFLNVLIMHGQAGYRLLCDTHLGNWHQEVKKALVSMIKSDHAIDLVTVLPDTVCKIFHHHGPEEQTNCYKRRALRPPPQSAVKTPRPVMKVLRPGVQDLHPSCDDMELDGEREDILQVSVPSFSCVHKRYPRINDSSSPPYFNEYVPDRLRKIRNTHLDDRMHYANPKYNAHHDSKVICEEKIRMVKRKIDLFREEGIELSEEEFERLMGRSEGSRYGAEEEDEGEDQSAIWEDWVGARGQYAFTVGKTGRKRLCRVC